MIATLRATRRLLPARLGSATTARPATGWVAPAAHMRAATVARAETDFTAAINRTVSLAGHSRRAMSTAPAAIEDDDEWAAAFKERIDAIRGDESYDESAAHLRGIVRDGLLRFTDLHSNPQRYFQAHRIIAARSPVIGPGFFIRLTVCFNLCTGTVLGLGGEDQIAELDKWQAQGALGCFALTEKFAGVNSGLVVNTAAEWDQDRGVFILNTPNEGSWKNWISQGFVADKAVVVANLTVGGASVGPHAFAMSQREGGEVTDGVTLVDMGQKTVGNDLDNASIGFDNVELPKAALLNRFCDIDDSGHYVQKIDGVPAFTMIGQRLFSGRVGVAQAALEFRRTLFSMTRAYSDSKMCWSPGGQIPLSSIPQLRSLYEEADERFAELDDFLAMCETELSELLRANKLPGRELIEAIAVAKVRAVQDSIDYCFRLKNEVGSYALMAGTGFDQSDFLQCCAFAEGDGRILQLKMARDRLRAWEKAGGTAALGAGKADAATGETRMLIDIEKALADGATVDDQWKEMYALAGEVMDRTMTTYLLRAGSF